MGSVEFRLSGEFAAGAAAAISVIRTELDAACYRLPKRPRTGDTALMIDDLARHGYHPRSRKIVRVAAS